MTVVSSVSVVSTVSVVYSVSTVSVVYSVSTVSGVSSVSDHMLWLLHHLHFLVTCVTFLVIVTRIIH